MMKLAEVLETCRVAANRTPASAQPALTGFIKPGSTLQASAQMSNTMFTPGKEWQMVVDLRKQLVFPREIMIATLPVLPDIFMWSAWEKRVHIIELTIPWEEHDSNPQRKHLKHSELAAECQRAGWKARVTP